MDSGEGLENFEPPQPKVAISPKQDDKPVENGQQLNNGAVTNEYYQQYLPYYTKAADSQTIHGQRDVLIEKLNYMIHLLEEQQEEKTSNVTEELILYMFLGVFVIFVVDSFARAGKYTR